MNCSFKHSCASLSLFSPPVCTKPRSHYIMIQTLVITHDLTIFLPTTSIFPFSILLLNHPSLLFHLFVLFSSFFFPFHLIIYPSSSFISFASSFRLSFPSSYSLFFLFCLFFLYFFPSVTFTTFLNVRNHSGYIQLLLYHAFSLIVFRHNLVTF